MRCMGRIRGRVPTVMSIAIAIGVGTIVVVMTHTYQYSHSQVTSAWNFNKKSDNSHIWPKDENKEFIGAVDRQVTSKKLIQELLETGSQRYHDAGIKGPGPLNCSEDSSMIFRNCRSECRRTQVIGGCPTCNETCNHLQPAGHESEGYILTLSFGLVDQHGVSLCSIQRQQCWLKSYGYGVHVVEPFTPGSHFESSPKYWEKVDSGESVLRFGDFFDMEYYHSVMRKHGVPDIVRWEDFVQKAPRNVIAVTINGNIGYDRRCYGLIRLDDRVCRLNRQPLNNHFTSGCNTAQVDAAMSYLTEKHGFVLHRHVCINCNSPQLFSPQDITKHIFRNDNPRNVTIVINVWYFLMSLVPNCDTGRYCAPFDFKQFLPSSRLHRDAQRYLKEILNTTSISVAIMFRTERLIKDLSAKGLLQRMDSMLQTYRQKVTDMAFSGKPLLTIDIGSYGSDSIYQYTPEYKGHYEEVITKFEHLLSVIYPKEEKWTLEDYEKGFSMIAGVKDRGYISALQRELASNAQCLMLYAGTGHYQRLVEFNYKDNHPKSSQCIWHL